MRYFIVLARDGDKVVLEDLRTHKKGIPGTLHQPNIIVFDDEYDDVWHEITRILDSKCTLTPFSDGKYPIVTDDGQVLYDIATKMVPLVDVGQVQFGSVIEVK